MSPDRGMRLRERVKPDSSAQVERRRAGWVVCGLEVQNEIINNDEPGRFLGNRTVNYKVFHVDCAFKTPE